MDVEVGLDPPAAARRLADLGFLASSDLPDRPGPAFLLVAQRAVPTLRHFDPERVEYWVTDGERGIRRALTRATRVPLATAFSWGLIRIIDRLKITNEYLTFGGWMCAESVGDDLVAVFTSPAPIVRRGGHSQIVDPAADLSGAWFGRFLLAVDYDAGFEALAARADPIARYAAFLGDALDRYRESAMVRSSDSELPNVLAAEAARIRKTVPSAWALGDAIRRAASCVAALDDDGSGPGRTPADRAGTRG